MAKIGGKLKSILVWTHERGTLQYDIICALILAFIFFVPKSCFNPRRQNPAQNTQTQTSRPAPNNPSQHQ